MATKNKAQVQVQRQKVAPEIQQRLRGMASELRQMVYGEAGCPEWGTLFQKIEDDGMSVGVELARLLMEQATAEQANRSEQAVCDVLYAYWTGQ
jgi:hypothetical protein